MCEDCIQALFDCGAKNVVFYSIAKTKQNYYKDSIVGKYSQNVLNILTALECKGISNRWVIDNYHSNMTSQELDERIRGTLQSKYCFDFSEKMEEVESYLNKSGEGIRFTALGDEDFPTCRFKQINKTDLPVFLAYKGDLNLLRENNFNIAVIGLLNPTLEIEHLERAVLKEILKFDTTIVSGLALGCDSIAHESVSSKNCTIAILPGTLDDILPKRNTALADDIVANKNGLLISEYYKPPTNRYDMIGRYTRRDRLQALFGDMVILTASYSESNSKRDKKKDSGSRHAMGKAKEYGIKRAVMYDENIFDNEMLI